MSTDTWNHCDDCGQFIPMADFESGIATHKLHTPDAEGSAEEWETLCKIHRNPIALNENTAPREFLEYLHIQFPDTIGHIPLSTQLLSYDKQIANLEAEKTKLQEAIWKFVDNHDKHPNVHGQPCSCPTCQKFRPLL